MFGLVIVHNQVIATIKDQLLQKKATALTNVNTDLGDTKLIGIQLTWMTCTQLVGTSVFDVTHECTLHRSPVPGAAAAATLSLTLHSLAQMQNDEGISMTSQRSISFKC